jgi:hypothetical protein
MWWFWVWYVVLPSHKSGHVLLSMWLDVSYMRVRQIFFNNMMALFHFSSKKIKEKTWLKEIESASVTEILNLSYLSVPAGTDMRGWLRFF